jgi:hypothetical protein
MGSVRSRIELSVLGDGLDDGPGGKLLWINLISARTICLHVFMTGRIVI